MKNLIFTASLLLSSCAILNNPTPTQLWAESEAAKYPKQAQIDYLKCSFLWPNQQCLQDNWKKYGAPVIDEKSNEEWKIKAHAFIKTMQEQGAAQMLRDNDHQCQHIHYFDDRLFSKSKQAICDSEFKYKIKYKAGNWNISIIKK